MLSGDTMILFLNPKAAIYVAFFTILTLIIFCSSIAKSGISLQGVMGSRASSTSSDIISSFNQGNNDGETRCWMTNEDESVDVAEQTR